MLTYSIKQFSQCKSTIKYVIYFTVKVKEVLENRNESRQVSFQISLALKLNLRPRTRISCLQALQFLLYAPWSLKQPLQVFFFS